MKKLTLEQTWVACLKMWRWVCKEVKRRNITPSVSSITSLKYEWLRNKGYITPVDSCFFCDYDYRYEADCRLCPAGRMEGGYEFWCELNRNPSDNDDWCDFAWFIDPHAFLRKLKSLNRKRKAKK